MNENMRKHYLDNLRWLIILILILYHAAQAWNVWNEPNYIIFEGNKIISSITVFFSPYFMPILFVLAGISTKYALQKRSVKEYFIERVKKLLIPFLFGTIVCMPVMVYIADKYNNSYGGSFFKHYAVFFTKWTDLTGADGGFSVGQFWFILYLFFISIIGVGIIESVKKITAKKECSIPFWLIFILGIPLPFLSEILSIGGKSIVEFTYLFLIGYYVFTDEKVLEKLEKFGWIFLLVGLVFTIANVYLFIWSGKDFKILNGVFNSVSEWFMIIALLGLAKRYLNFNGKISNYMKQRSFLYYTFHFVWVIVFQYLFALIWKDNTFALYVVPMLPAMIMTFVCCEICIRIPVMCFLTGAKYCPSIAMSDETN